MNKANVSHEAIVIFREITKSYTKRIIAHRLYNSFDENDKHNNIDYIMVNWDDIEHEPLFTEDQVKKSILDEIKKLIKQKINKDVPDDCIYKEYKKYIISNILSKE